MSSENDQTKFDNLEQQLEAFIENSRQLCVVAADFQTGGQSVLDSKLNTLVSGLKQMENGSNNFHNVKIPLELFQYIDEGKNPLLYTRQVLENTMAKNEDLNGKIEMYTKFRATLLKELGEELPKQTNLYRSIRKEDNFASP